MIAVWILLALAALIVLICLLRVGVDASYEDNTFALKVVAGPVNLTILPKKPKPEKKAEGFPPVTSISTKEKTLSFFPLSG